MEVSYTKSIPDKSGGAYIRINSKFKSLWQFKLIPEGYLPKFFKTLRLVTELQVDDEKWDDTIYIYGEDENIKKLLKSSSRLRHLTSELIEKKLKIEFSEDGITIEKYVAKEKFEQTFEEFRPDIIELSNLVIEAIKSGLIAKQNSNFIKYVAFTTLFIGAHLLTFIFTSFFNEGPHFIIKNVFFFVSVIFAVVLNFGFVLLWRFIRRLHSRSHLEFLLIIALGIPSMTITINRYLIYLNRTFDKHPGYEADMTLNRKQMYRNKHGYHYVLYFNYNIPEQIKLSQKVKSHSLDVSKKTFLLKSEGEILKARIYPGYFGQPWVKLLD